MHLANNIDLVSGLAGGCILGLSTSALLFATGKITGISGIFENIVVADVWHGNFAYIAGLCTAGLSIAAFKPELFGSGIEFSHMELALGGLLVGFGTRMGSGCTSGHGLCGLSRLSPRSGVAVGTFMATGAATAYVSNSTQLLNGLKTTTFAHQLVDSPMYLYLGGAVFAAYNAYFWFMKRKIVLPALDGGHFVENLAYFTSALLFGIGLGISGMCDANRVLNFLNFAGSNGFDPSLMGVMGGGVLVNLLTNWYLHKAELDAPLAVKTISHAHVLKMGTHESNLKIDSNLVIGSALFGMGWGLVGMCPGPALVSWAGSVGNSLYFVPFMMTGIAIRHQLFELNNDTVCAAKKK